MKQVNAPKRQIRRLEEDEKIKSFSCGDADLDDFILNEAPYYRDALLAVSYVMEQDDKPIAYFSLANDRVSIQDFETNTEFNRFRRHRFVNEKRKKSGRTRKKRMQPLDETEKNHSMRGKLSTNVCISARECVTAARAINRSRPASSNEANACIAFIFCANAVSKPVGKRSSRRPSCSSIRQSFVLS